MSKKIKHSKVKNTGIIFELLVRQLTSDILNGKGTKDSKALNVIKRYFKEGTELSKELSLYQSLVKETCNSENEANYLIDAAIKKRNKLDEKKLSKQRYNLVGEIKENYDFDSFFKSRVNNYKEFASVYKIFEANIQDRWEDVNPKDEVRSRYTIVENLTGKNKDKERNKKVNKTLKEYKTQTKDLRLLAYKMLIEKFNAKYSHLDQNQKDLLREYIYHAKDITALKETIDKRIPNLKRQLNVAINHLKEDDNRDKTIKIKLKEAVKLLDEIKNKDHVKDGDVTSMLLFYELLKEIKN